MTNITVQHFNAILNKTKCVFWNDDFSRTTYIGELVGILYNSKYKFVTMHDDYISLYMNCKVIIPTTKIKTYIEIAKSLTDMQFIPDEYGNFRKAGEEKIWSPKMWKTCEMNLDEAEKLGFQYIPEWIEIVEPDIENY